MGVAVPLALGVLEATGPAGGGVLYIFVCYTHHIWSLKYIKRLKKRNLVLIQQINIFNQDFWAVHLLTISFFKLSISNMTRKICRE